MPPCPPLIQALKSIAKMITGMSFLFIYCRCKTIRANRNCTQSQMHLDTLRIGMRESMFTKLQSISIESAEGTAKTLRNLLCQQMNKLGSKNEFRKAKNL